ncbi:MAG: ATP-binding protein [Oscillospiraceae bacterium]|nr:ATP-binding protein [Oscillospiraceae bacterium]
MLDFHYKIAGICCFNVKDDPVICGFSKLFGKSASKSAEAYSQIISALLLVGKTLSEYLKDMLIFSDSPVVCECANSSAPLGKAAVEYDLGVIRSIAETSSAELKEQLSRRFDNDVFKALPDYERGEFNWDADYFLDFARKHGSGIFAKYKAFTYNGELVPIEQTDPIRLHDLKNYESQRSQVVDNTLCFMNGKPAQNVLLYGDRGTGKSATVKAVLNEFDELRMVEVSKNNIALLPDLFRVLKSKPLRFIVTIDDLSFAENDDRFGILKAVLEGSLSQKPGNVLIYATTNRRKIVRETAADREISGADAIDESMSLADRFGLFVTFVKPDKRVYLDIVSKLAEDAGLNVPEEKLFAAAEQFALRHTGRSPRTARQFVDWLTGRIALNLEY